MHVVGLVGVGVNVPVIVVQFIVAAGASLSSFPFPCPSLPALSPCPYIASLLFPPFFPICQLLVAWITFGQL